MRNRFAHKTNCSTHETNCLADKPNYSSIIPFGYQDKTKRFTFGSTHLSIRPKRYPPRTICSISEPKRFTIRANNSTRTTKSSTRASIWINNIAKSSIPTTSRHANKTKDSSISADRCTHKANHSSRIAICFARETFYIKGKTPERFFAYNLIVLT